MQSMTVFDVGGAKNAVTVEVDRRGQGHLDRLSFEIDYRSQTVLVWPLRSGTPREGLPYCVPPCLWQITHDRTDSAPLRQGSVIEIQRACRWHAICHSQDDFCHQVSNGSGRGRHDNLV
jgi:hypothetical protein